MIGFTFLKLFTQVRVNISIYRQEMVPTAELHTVVGVILTHSSLKL